jgi:hypothetical protein
MSVILRKANYSCSRLLLELDSGSSCGFAGNKAKYEDTSCTHPFDSWGRARWEQSEVRGYLHEFERAACAGVAREEKHSEYRTAVSFMKLIC